MAPPTCEYKGSEMNLFQASDEVQTKVPRLNPSSGILQLKACPQIKLDFKNNLSASGM